jgi:hypothetical protein
LFMAEPDRAHRGVDCTYGRPLEVTGTPPPGAGQRTSRGAHCTQAYGVRKSESEWHTWCLVFIYRYKSCGRKTLPAHCYH